MVLGGIHKTKDYCRKRLASPRKFDPRSFRTKTVSRRTKLIVACPKSHYNPKTKRCKVGTRVQAVLKKKLTSGACPRF